MDKNKQNIPVSALYTAATWRWADMPCAEFVTPQDAAPVFRLVNLFMVFYRWINPRKFSLRHQLLHRHTAIDHLLDRCDCQRIVEIASGFSPRGSRMSARPELEYIEIDLPDVVAGKYRRLQETAEGRAVLARPNLRLQSGDITTLDFTQFAGRPTAVVTEGLMMYFPRETQLLIWQRISALLSQEGGVYLFDYIPQSDEPPRSWLGQLLHLVRVHVFGIHSDFAYDHRTRDDVMRDLEYAGFSDVVAIDTGEVAAAWGLPQSHIPSRTIIFRCRIKQARSVLEVVHG